MAEKLTEIADNSKELLRLEILSKAQEKQIKDLNKRISEYKEEISKLKQELDNSKRNPIKSEIEVITGVSVEEMICMQEISKLKQFSDERELTHEEAKKLEIYVKVLNGKKTDDKDKKDNSTSKMTDAELLQFMKQMDASSKQ